MGAAGAHQDGEVLSLFDFTALTGAPTDDAFYYCVPLFSLADGAADVRVRRVPAGGFDGEYRAAGGPCAPTAAPVVPDPETGPPA
jgi:hypothetical protein